MLGIAVGCHVRAANEPTGSGHPCGPDHIARIAYDLAGGSGEVFFDFELPPSRGLGFSAAARAAGAVLAFLEQGHDIAESQARGYEIVLQLEGHGDNAAPAVFGGLHVIAGGENHRLQASLPGQLLLWVPELDTTPTDESRAKMSATVTRADAVFNLGRVGLLIAALYENDASLLRRATEDRIHQPERLAAAPQTGQAMNAALNAGASAAWLSGSGPTVAMVVDPEVCQVVSAALPSTGRVLVADLDILGAVPV